MTLLSFIHFQSFKNAFQHFCASLKLAKFASKKALSTSVLLTTTVVCSALLSSTAALAEPLTFNLEAQPLSAALKEYGKTVGITIAVDGKLIAGKNAPALKGRYDPDQALSALLKGSGLKSVTEDGTVIIRQSSANDAEKIELKEVKVRAKRFKQIGPLPGLDLTKEQIAGNIQSISAKEIKEAHSLSLADLLNSKLQSVNVNDYQGNPFQMDVTYRGFTASPQIGSPQGLSVFFDGIRVNEPFGDVVNWDMIPMNALGSFDLIPGSNPLFGLNTLGGALSMKTKSGFTDAGLSAEVLTGSFGRKQLQASGGWNNALKEEGSWDTTGDYAAFGAINVFMEDGWRDNSPSEVNQAFGKLEWQGERASLALSSLGVVNKLTGNGTVPQELYNQDSSAVFTSPDVTKNKLFQMQLSGIFDVNDTVNVTGMVYHRQSDRKSNTGDIIDFESFNQSDSPDNRYLGSRRAAPGETITCALADDDRDGIPNYYVLDENNFFPFLISGDPARDTPGGFDYESFTTLNGAIPADLRDALRNQFNNNPVINGLGNNNFEAPSLDGGSGTPVQFLKITSGGLTFNDVDVNGDPVRRLIFAAAPINRDTCVDEDSGTGVLANRAKLFGSNGVLVDEPARDRDGSNDPATKGRGAGVVQGTPTAIITKSNIQQTSQGANLQVNFNFDQHKFMVGTAIEHSVTEYIAKQRLGTLDDKRNVTNDPALLGEEYFFATRDATINEFDGSSITKSLYASETWSATENLNLSLSGRYNHTRTKNKIAPRVSGRNLAGFNFYNRFPGGAVVLPGNDIAESPIDLSKPIPADSPFITGNTLTTLPAATEQFSFHRFNPAIGATWQAKPNLNIYANMSQGTRVPSSVELGCAYDGTLVSQGNGQNGEEQFAPRSIVEGRGCSLPSTLSGDPFLPQVKAQTIEAGARGKFGEFMEWNITAYRTDLRDDIYLTSLTPELSFFQNIGNTRRQGIEFGFAGEYGKSDFRVNYSLTEATFQCNFNAISPNNSSRGLYGVNENFIQVKPGNVMPGVPFNNINFNWGYQFTPKFKMNTTVVAHSESFLRGNENNSHTPSQGPVVIRQIGTTLQSIKLPDNEYSGKAPGYAVLNMNARYVFGNGWSASALMNNILDKKYYTAGRLGINPIAPSTFGAIGPGGFNYNSNEWIPSQFISAGAPRGVWFSVSYDFDPSKKATPKISFATEPNLADLESPSITPTAEEIALNKQLSNMKVLPVLKRKQISTKVAKQQVADALEAWRNTFTQKQFDAYIATYAADYTPKNITRDQWLEAEKMRFVMGSKSSLQLNKVVVVPEGKNMVAVFNEVSTVNNQQQNVIKALTYELENGKWQITREQVTNNNAMALSEMKKTSDKTSNLQLTNAEKKSSLNLSDSLTYSEVK